MNSSVFMYIVIVLDSICVCFSKCFPLDIHFHLDTKLCSVVLCVRLCRQFFVLQFSVVHLFIVVYRVLVVYVVYCCICSESLFFLGLGVVCYFCFFMLGDRMHTTLSLNIMMYKTNDNISICRFRGMFCTSCYLCSIGVSICIVLNLGIGT
jgi:hypothetical protein